VRTRTSQIGRSKEAFTLLELVVVLAIVGVVIGAGIPLFGKMQSHIRVFQATQSLLTDLRQAHKEAMAQHKIITITFYPSENRYRLENSDRLMDVELGISVENGLGLSQAQTQEVHFYPDGSATPAVMTLSTGDRRSKLKIEWLTGQIRAANDA
jgi:type II secretion system protein H